MERNCKSEHEGPTGSARYSDCVTIPKVLRSHFDGKRFHNPVPRRQGFRSLLRWLTSRRQGPWREWTNAPFGPPPPKQSHELRITFVNHTTFLIQVCGVNILTDPIWSKRASPVTWAGPRRRRPPAIRFEDLPRIDVVLLSHDHYDHLDVSTLKWLAREHAPLVCTGLGVSKLLAKHGVGNVAEFDWWDAKTVLSRITITSIPAQHFSGRSLLDRDTTLWCGFMIESPSATICFAADTGLGIHFPEIARQFPHIDVAILPIGAFRPEWFMGEVHMSPADAVEAHLQLGAHISVASHFGTFPLADDGEDEPVEQLRNALHKNRHRMTGTEFLVMDFGEGRVFAASQSTEHAAPESNTIAPPHPEQFGTPSGMNFPGLD